MPESHYQQAVDAGTTEILGRRRGARHAAENQRSPSRKGAFGADLLSVSGATGPDP